MMSDGILSAVGSPGLATVVVGVAAAACGGALLMARRHHHNSHTRAVVRKFSPFTPQLLEDGTPAAAALDTPAPGCITQADFAEPPGQRQQRQQQQQQPARGDDDSELVVASWNIERGYKLAEVITALQQVDADVVLLQECDIGCARSGHRNVPAEIARALRMHVVYAADAWHVNTIHENDASAAGARARPAFDQAPADGCEGNAVLTKWPVLDAEAVLLPCVRNSHMPDHRDQKRHTAPAVTIATPQCGPVLVYSVHFDAFSGRRARATGQYGCIYTDALSRRQRRRRLGTAAATAATPPASPASSSTQTTQLTPTTARSFSRGGGGSGGSGGSGDSEHPCAVIVAGDFNTHNHGLARLWAPYTGDCPDRWRHWGQSEARWWVDHVLGHEQDLGFAESAEATAPPSRSHGSGVGGGGGGGGGKSEASGTESAPAVVAGTSPVTPLRLADPFDPDADFTVTHRVCGVPVYRGKLDWLLHDTRRLRCRRKQVTRGCAGGASDHELLVCAFSARPRRMRSTANATMSEFE